MSTPARAPTSRGFTWDDFVRLPEDDPRELVDGALIETEMPTEAHERIILLLGHFLLSWVLPRKAGQVYASAYKLRVSDDRGVMPDLQFYAADNPTKRDPQGVTEGRPDLVIEVVSPSSARYDRIKKLNWYVELGVPEYWIVNPETYSLERLALREGGYTITHALTGRAVFEPPSFEGLRIELEHLWGPDAEGVDEDGAPTAEKAPGGDDAASRGEAPADPEAP